MEVSKANNLKKRKRKERRERERKGGRKGGNKYADKKPVWVVNCEREQISVSYTSIVKLAASRLIHNAGVCTSEQAALCLRKSG